MIKPLAVALALLAGLAEGAVLPDLTGLAPAEDSGFPDAAVIKSKIAELQPLVSEAMNVAPANRNELDVHVSQAPVVAMPPTPKGAETKGFDLGRIVADYERLQAGGSAEGQAEHELLVLISFSMPDAVIKQYLEQAARYKATIVLRGTPDGDLKSIGATQQRLVALKPQAMPRVDINPNAFRKYDIKRVPSIVLGHTKPGQRLDENGCAPAEDYLVVTGEVSIPYAMSLFRRSQSDELRRLVQLVQAGASR